MAFVVLCTPVSVPASEVTGTTTSGVYGSLNWELDGTILTVTGNGEIGKDAPWNTYSNKTQITGIHLGEGITKLSEESFDSYTALTEITLPDTLERIENYAFYGCSSLKAITIPKNVSYVGVYVFSGCRETVITFAGWKCQIHDGSMPTDTGIRLRGYAKSTAETYAKENSIPFETMQCGGHSYTETENPSADCTHAGKITRICAKCGDTQVENVAALGHDWSGWATTKEATCTENGLRTRSCMRAGCSETENDILYATGHQYEEVAHTESSCTQKGVTTYRCAVCGDSYEEIEESLKHSYDSGVEVQKPSENEPGRMKYTCQNCGQIYYKKIGLIRAPEKISVDASVQAQTVRLNVSYPGGGKVSYYSYDSKVKVDQNGVVSIPAKYTGQVNILVSVDATDEYESMGTSILISLGKIPANITAGNIKKTASSVKNQTFSLGIKRNGNGKITYSSFHPKVKVNARGNVTIAKNFVGTAYLVIRTQETQDYEAGVKKIAIQVAPEQTSLSGIQNLKGKKMKLSWNTKSSATGYEIQYSSSSNFKNAKTIAKKGYQNKTVTISGLTKNKTYYTRIRIVRRAAGADVFSPWSAAKRIKITK